MKSLKESILGDPEQIMNNGTIDAIVAEYNSWLHNNCQIRNAKITAKNVIKKGDKYVVENPFTITIRELPPCDTIVPQDHIDSIHASIGINKRAARAGVTLKDQIKCLKKIIEDSGGWRMTKFVLDNDSNGITDKTIDISDISHIETEEAVLKIGNCDFDMPYIWNAKSVDIMTRGGNVHMMMMPANVKSLKITRLK